MIHSIRLFDEVVTINSLQSTCYDQLVRIDSFDEVVRSNLLESTRSMKLFEVTCSFDQLVRSINLFVRSTCSFDQLVRSINLFDEVVRSNLSNEVVTINLFSEVVRSTRSLKMLIRFDQDNTLE